MGDTDGKKISFFGNSRTANPGLKLTKLASSCNSISYAQLRRRLSTVEKNAIIMKNMKIPDRKRSRKPPIKLVFNSTFSLNGSVAKYNQLHYRNPTPVSFYNNKPERSRLTTAYKSEVPDTKDSMLNLLEKSQKLNSYIEKLGQPCHLIDTTLLWSKGVRKRREFFNSSVCNSCLLSSKLFQTHS